MTIQFHLNINLHVKRQKSNTTSEQTLRSTCVGTSDSPHDLPSAILRYVSSNPPLLIYILDLFISTPPSSIISCISLSSHYSSTSYNSNPPDSTPHFHDVLYEFRIARNTRAASDCCSSQEHGGTVRLPMSTQPLHSKPAPWLHSVAFYLFPSLPPQTP